MKAYITRWRNEEMFRVQKSEFGLEDMRVISLKKMNHMLFFVAAMITFMSMKIEKDNVFFAAAVLYFFTKHVALKQEIR